MIDLERTHGASLGRRVFCALLVATLGIGREAPAATGKLVLEAEKAEKIVAHFVVKTTKDAKVPSGKYLACPPGACGKDKVDLRGYAEYTLDVKEKGVYYLWVRAFWENGCGNSVWIQIDGKPGASGDEKGLVVGEDGTYNNWDWKGAKKHRFELTAGKHKLTMLVREDGVRIDQILLTKDREYVPVRAEKPTQ